MLNQIGRRLTENLAEAGRRRRLLLLLDEFPALGRLDFFESALAFIAGYGLRAFLIAQSLNQIERAYGPNHVLLVNLGSNLQSVDFEFRGFQDQDLSLVRNQQITSLLDIQGGTIFLRMGAWGTTLPFMELRAIFLSNESSQSFYVDGKYCKGVAVARRTLEGYLLRRSETEDAIRCDVPRGKN